MIHGFDEIKFIQLNWKLNVLEHCSTLIMRIKTIWHAHSLDMAQLHTHGQDVHTHTLAHSKSKTHEQCMKCFSMSVEGSTRLNSIQYTHIFISDISYFVHTTFNIFYLMPLS